MKLKNISEKKSKTKTIDTEKILSEDKDEVDDEKSDEMIETKKDVENDEIITQPETEVKMTASSDSFSGLTDSDLDSIIEETFGGMSIYSRIDMMIDEFIENLKG